MSITHEEARRMIQFDADKALDARGRRTLDAHLDKCADCRFYAGEIGETEGILRRVMKQQWSYHPLPLPMDMIMGGNDSKIYSRIILATRFAAIALVFVLSVVSLWQVTQPNQTTPPFMAMPVPTPSVQFTHTTVSVTDCRETRYKVREEDTLESIARRFSLSTEAILSANAMNADAIIHADMELVIPLCGSTPTTHPPTITTYPPATHFTTHTPGG